MINIVGTYECKVDSKARILLPSPLKRQLQNVLNKGFVIKRSVFQNCLEIYPMQEWNLVVSQVNRLNRFVKKNNEFIRAFLAGLKVIDVDSSGRLLIPKDLLLFANLNKEVVLSSSVNMIEIWDKEDYEVSVAETLQDFDKLTEDDMGINSSQNIDGIS